MKLYARWMHCWERSLTKRDHHRKIFPFSWGLDWIEEECPPGTPPLQFLEDWSARHLKESLQFYEPPRIENFSFQQDRLTFQTPTPCRHEENNVAYCRCFAARNAESAVVVIPQWNAGSPSHVGLCRFIQKMGITAVRVTLPYHEQRCPAGMRRADYMVSPNIGRTVHSVRQAVLEVRQVVRWLIKEGYRQIGVVGTSIGSCVGYLAFTHDRSIATGVFNHVSSHFADAVWTGLSTRYVRWGLEGQISLEQLRRCWELLSPWQFVHRLAGAYREHLLIMAKYDLTFVPELGRQILSRYREFEIPTNVVELPCGHYTTALFPFRYLDAWHICKFLRRRLG